MLVFRLWLDKKLEFVIIKSSRVCRGSQKNGNRDSSTIPFHQIVTTKGAAIWTPTDGVQDKVSRTICTNSYINTRLESYSGNLSCQRVHIQQELYYWEITKGAEYSCKVDNELTWSQLTSRLCKTRKNKFLTDIT